MQLLFFCWTPVYGRTRTVAHSHRPQVQRVDQIIFVVRRRHGGLQVQIELLLELVFFLPQLKFEETHISLAH